jgi:NAD-dependent deacetylase
MSAPPALDRVARALAPGARITVMTGAGVSAASGVPTFRGADGLWKHFRVEDLATPDAFTRDPRSVWEWYDWRRAVIAGCQPNPAHHVLASWRLRFPRFTLITQNVDGLHERAGADGVLRLHGSIWDVGCWNECSAAPHRWRDDTVPFPVLPPPCPHCGGPLRPGVVWFGEMLDTDVVDRCLEATRCDVFFTIGTSSVVYPAAGFLDHARRYGAMTVEINPEATPASSSVDAVLAERAELALAALDASLGPHPLALETSRLRMEPLLPRDVEAAHVLWTHPDVRRFLWDDRTIPLGTAEEVARASARDFARRGFGLWLLFARDRPGTLAGFCGLRTQGVGQAPELLFGLHPDCWRRGLAQEASRAVFDYAFATLRLPRVIAATDAPNERSARTLAALGMHFDRRADAQGSDILFYSIESGPSLRGGGRG